MMTTLVDLAVQRQSQRTDILASLPTMVISVFLLTVFLDVPQNSSTPWPLQMYWLVAWLPCAQFSLMQENDPITPTSNTTDVVERIVLLSGHGGFPTAVWLIGMLVYTHRITAWFAFRTCQLIMGVGVLVHDIPLFALTGGTATTYVPGSSSFASCMLAALCHVCVFVLSAPCTREWIRGVGLLPSSSGHLHGRYTKPLPESKLWVGCLISIGFGLWFQGVWLSRWMRLGREVAANAVLRANLQKSLATLHHWLD